MKTRDAHGAKPRVLLGVTAPQSLGLLGAVPSKLAEEGFDVHLVASGVGPGHVGPGLAGAVIHEVPMARQPSPFRDLVALVAMARLIRDLDPEVVVMGTPKASLLGLLAARLHGVPERVYHVRGLRLETEVGLRRKLLAALESLTLASSTRAVAVSESLRRELVPLGKRASTAVVLGKGSSKGVDTDRFTATRPEEERREAKVALGIDPEAIVVGFVGRLTHDKGILDLLAANQTLSDAGSSHQLLLVGPVEDEKVESLLRQSRSENITLVGNSDTVEDLYAAMDLFCLPTLREGFPNVVLEASATGLPVVTTTATGAIDSVVEGKTGIAVPPGDSEALAEALGRLIDSPEERRKMGAAARAHVEKNFRQEDVEAGFVQYVQRVAAAAAKIRSRRRRG